MANYEKINEETKAALLKLALGYDYEDKEVIASPSGQAEKIKVTKKHVPPNMKAIVQIQRLIKRGEW